MYQSNRSFTSHQQRTSKPEVLGPVHSPTSPIEMLQTELNCSIIDIPLHDDNKEDENSLTVAETSCSSRRRSDGGERRHRGSILKSSSFSSNSNGGETTKKRISFSEDQVFSVSKYDNYDDMFYDQQSLADFRYEAMLWEAGVVDDDGYPLDLSIPTNKNNLEDEGSLDFDDLLLQDDDEDDIIGNLIPIQNSNNDHHLEDQEEAQAYNHASIRAMKRTLNPNDSHQWRSTQKLCYDHEEPTNKNNLEDEGSLDFDDLLLQDDDDDDDIIGNLIPIQNSNNNHHVEDQEEAQAYNHASIRAMKRTLNPNDSQQWRSTQKLCYDHEESTNKNNLEDEGSLDFDHLLLQDDDDDIEDSDEEEDMKQRHEAARRKVAFRQSQEQLQESFRKSPQYINRRKYDGRRRRISFEISKSILRPKMEQVVNHKSNNNKSPPKCPTSQDDADTRDDFDIHNNNSGDALSVSSEVSRDDKRARIQSKLFELEKRISSRSMQLVLQDSDDIHNNSRSDGLSPTSEVSRDDKRARIQSKMFGLEKRISSRSMQLVLQDSDDHDNVKVKSSLIAKHNMYSPSLTNKNSSASVSADQKHKMQVPDMQD